MCSKSFLLAGACFAWPAAGMAQNAPKVVVDISAGGTVENNPFLEQSGEAAGSVFIRVDPSVFFEDPLGETVVNGSVRLSQYTNRYGSDLSARAGVSSRRQVDERTTLRIGAGIQSSRTSVQDALVSGNIDLIDPTLDFATQVPTIDSTIAGTRSRVTSLNAQGSLGYQLDPVSTVSLGLNAGSVTYSDDIGFDFRNFGAQTSYSRKISPRTTAFVDGQISKVDYLGRDVGDSTIKSVGVGISQQLDSALSWNARLGADFVKTDLGPNGNSDKTSLSGSVGLCYRGLGQAICASAQRSARPTALGGVTAVSTFALNYQRQLSQVNSFNLSARYGKTNESFDGITNGANQSNDFIGASATYSHRLNDDLNFFVTPSISKIFDNIADRRANIALSVGITKRLGRR